MPPRLTEVFVVREAGRFPWERRLLKLDDLSHMFEFAYRSWKSHLLDLLVTGKGEVGEDDYEFEVVTGPDRRMTLVAYAKDRSRPDYLLDRKYMSWDEVDHDKIPPRYEPDHDPDDGTEVRPPDPPPVPGRRRSHLGVVQGGKGRGPTAA